MQQAPSVGLDRNLRVVELDPETDPRWVTFLARHPGGTVYHHPAWLASLQSEYRRPAVNLACVDGAGLVHGILPLIATRGLPFRVGRHTTARRLASLPRTPFAGPLAADPVALAGLVTAAVERVRAEQGMTLQLKLPAPVPEIEASARELQAVPWREAYVLDLPAPDDELRLGRTAKERGTIRWSARRCEKLGLRIRDGDSEADLRTWYGLYLDVMRWHLVPPRPYRFFAALWARGRSDGLVRLRLAEDHGAQPGRAVAGMLSLQFAGTVSWGFAGIRHDVSASASPLDALHYRAIHDAWREGYRHYDFGEVLDGDIGLAHFKRKWGGRAVRLQRYEYPAPAQGPDGHVEVSDSVVRRSLERMWRKVPVGVTALIGDGVYRFL